MENSIPQILYKYRSFDDQRARNMLRDNQIYFASPLQFNDPFDCHAQEYMYEVLQEDLIKIKASLVFKVAPELLSSIQIETVREEYKEETEKNENRVRPILAELRNTFGCLSLSESDREILMWSHYANSHNGYCIGYKFKLDSKYFKKVVYSRARNLNFLLAFFKDQPTREEFEESLMEEYFLTKYISWEYEKEWRILSSPPSCAGTYTNSEIESITFGLKMPSEHRDVIREILKDKKINYFEAIKSKINFAIEIRKIDG